jgi:hypothetical protein
MRPILLINLGATLSLVFSASVIADQKIIIEVEGMTCKL